jgi:hypothetical protein
MDQNRHIKSISLLCMNNKKTKTYGIHTILYTYTYNIISRNHIVLPCKLYAYMTV